MFLRKLCAASQPRSRIEETLQQLSQMELEKVVRIMTLQQQ